MTIHMNLGKDSYDILVERGIIAKAHEHLNLNRRVLVVTDTGVPAEYAETVAALCKESVICNLEMGEASKSLEGFGRLLSAMLEHSFSRKDCVVAVGGGVVGDLAGFAASAYMRGIDFYNIPTTLLSQIDSSIGGKTAINFGGVKNIVGAFYQPKKVLIDPDLLKTLPPARSPTVWPRPSRWPLPRIRYCSIFLRIGMFKATSTRSLSAPSRSRRTWWSRTSGKRDFAGSSTSVTRWATVLRAAGAWLSCTTASAWPWA